jgi:type IV fimbrial biogenesis protein FimT
MRPVAAPNRKFTNGFTVIELLVTLTMLGILIAIALPNFREASLNGATTAQTNDLVTAFNLARAEATKQSVPVRISAVGGDWQNGWEAATDRNQDGLLDANDLLVRTGDAARDGFTWIVADVGGNPVNDIWFNATGRLLGSAQPIVVTIRRPGGDTAKSRRLCIALSGRVESKKGESACL